MLRRGWRGARDSPRRYTPGVRVLLVSTYELGHQPLSVASGAAVLTRAGHEVRCADIAVEPLKLADIDWAQRVALSVPMHTAMRLALEAAKVIRQRKPATALCYFGLYAGTAKQFTGSSTADALIAGEFEQGLTSWAGGGDPGPQVALARLGNPVVPDRRGLPPLEAYTRLSSHGEERVVGSVAASRGCSHRCRHCPVPVVYDARVRPVEAASVLGDIDALVAAGAGHINFADPDFLNAPQHSRRILETAHERHPHLSFDVTIKVEHILRHRELLPVLADAGCAFVVSAFESANDRILGILDKGHTVSDASQAVLALREYNIEVRPSWLPFTPWTTVEDLVDLLDFVVAHDLVANVDPVQYSVRLLVPEGSLLLRHPAMEPYLGGYDPALLGWTWAHPDAAIDELQKTIADFVESAVGEPPAATFERIESLIRSADGDRSTRPPLGLVSRGPNGERAHLSEPWFCCSEPTRAQLSALGAGCAKVETPTGGQSH